MIEVRVRFEERYWYPHEGGQVWIAGYTPVDADGRFLARDAPELAGRGLRVAGVAGAAQHHAEVLEQARLGESLTLRRDPDNPHDPNAIAVHCPAGQLGWVPREVAAELAPQLDAGEPWSALLLRERRDSPRDPRSGVVMLLGADTELVLRPSSG